VKLSERIRGIVGDALHAEFKSLRVFMTREFTFLRAQLGTLRRLVFSEFDRLEARLDGRVDRARRRESCYRSRRGCRTRRPR
jgi:hypothetical protein